MEMMTSRKGASLHHLDLVMVPLCMFQCLILMEVSRLEANSGRVLPVENWDIPVSVVTTVNSCRAGTAIVVPLLLSMVVMQKLG